MYRDEHRICVIAKIRGRFRSLASAHRQNCCALEAIHLCMRLINAFEEPQNAKLIKHELLIAAEMLDEVWSSNDYCFPILTTCLMSTACFDPTTNDYSRAFPIPFDAILAGQRRTPTVIVIDITDLNRIKYCFADSRARCLSANEYATLYSVDPSAKSATNLVQLCLRPSIYMIVLIVLWPRSSWASMNRDAVDPIATLESSTEELLGAPQLQRVASQRLVRQILEMYDGDLENFTEDAFLIPGFVNDVFRYLHQNPAAALTSGGFFLLKNAVMNKEIVDLSPFRYLDDDAILNLMEGNKTVTKIDVSNNVRLTGRFLDKISRKTNLETIICIGIPNIGVAEVHNVATHTDIRVIASSSFAYALEPHEAASDLNRVTKFPLKQILVGCARSNSGAVDDDGQYWWDARDEGSVFASLCIANQALTHANLVIVVHRLLKWQYREKPEQSSRDMHIGSSMSVSHDAYPANQIRPIAGSPPGGIFSFDEDDFYLDFINPNTLEYGCWSFLMFKHIIGEGIDETQHLKYGLFSRESADSEEFVVVDFPTFVDMSIGMTTDARHREELLSLWRLVEESIREQENHQATMHELTSNHGVEHRVGKKAPIKLCTLDEARSFVDAMRMSSIRMEDTIMTDGESSTDDDEHDDEDGHED